MPEASAIQRMFEQVAPRYDLLNRVLSLGIDRSWRRTVVESLELQPSDHVLDLCCGTGDLALAIAAHARCTASDFTWNMLTRARAKVRASQPTREVALAAADTLRLPFRSGVFDAATVAFGVRNLEDMPAGLGEMRRVLRPGGGLAILEFSHPTHWVLKRPYRFYLNTLLPRVGGMLSARGEAYRYLAESIMGFPEPEILCDMLQSAGFTETRYRQLTGGIVAVHRATATG